jgi:hypothetical protein
MRLILTTFQTCSNLQQPPSKDSPLVASAAGAGVTPKSDYGVDDEDHAFNLIAAILNTADMSTAVHQHFIDSSLQSLAGARELLLCPELKPCLATSSILTLFGLDTGKDDGAGTGDGTRDALRPASNSRSTAGSSRSSKTGRTGTCACRRRNPRDVCSSKQRLLLAEVDGSC